MDSYLSRYGREGNMSELVTVALIGVTIIVLLLFWLASAHYVSEVLADSDDEHDDHGGHGGAGH